MRGRTMAMPWLPMNIGMLMVMLRPVGPGAGALVVVVVVGGMNETGETGESEGLCLRLSFFFKSTN
jgi:hypothetical protein